LQARALRNCFDHLLVHCPLRSDSTAPLKDYASKQVHTTLAEAEPYAREAEQARLVDSAAVRSGGGVRSRS
jgi:hypothetical protein